MHPCCEVEKDVITNIQALKQPSILSFSHNQKNISIEHK
jgi:hypothetical protein